MLLKAGANVHLLGTSRPGPEGSVLHEAILRGETDIFLLLLQAGASVHTINSKKRTVLDVAKNRPYLPESIKALLVRAEAGEFARDTKLDAVSKEEA